MRTLYLARHGEASGSLTDAGRAQALLLGERLSAVPLTEVFHSPVRRAAETAALVSSSLKEVPVSVSPLVGDYLPYAPSAAELAPEFAPIALAHVADYTTQQHEIGPGLADRALAEFTAPVSRADLIITHSQIVCWFVRAALGAPPARWLGINAANAALTVIQYRPGWPPSVVMFNDQAHLPPSLRWTGFPDERRAAW
ncbi:histidine phosphatase family protein [Actinophytocola oryzae]|uniref:Putative phosphoglycerate mutase n=1 Tax=Actinophytocola oryzae TaxID=502181 RepID=A0A4R7VD17_9PSEU|nr:histidine phosphatase family protein [Actinophytocola oryzae]TDV47023.1 putative phosphoglycerate mutase [Actinophytocola oryzae]